VRKVSPASHFLSSSTGMEEVPGSINKSIKCPFLPLPYS